MQIKDNMNTFRLKTLLSTLTGKMSAKILYDGRFVLYLVAFCITGY